jgi:tetratricopeptide (TPR) repeat protein
MKVTLAAGLIAGVALLAGSPAWAAGNKNSDAVAKILNPAQEALKKKDYAGAIAKIKEANALATKTPFDEYTIHEFFCAAYAGTANYPEAGKECEAKLDSSFMPEAEKPKLTLTLLNLNFQLKNYDKAIEFGQRAVKGGFATEETKNLLAQAYYLKGDWKDALKTEEPLVDSEIKAGEQPKEQQLALVLNACIKLDDKACQEHAVERLVTYYPKPDLWAQLLFTVLHDASGNDTNTMEVYRLMFEVDTLKNAGDYNEMAQMALEQGSPGEAVKVLDKGFQANVFTDQRAKERNTRLLDTAKKTAASDQTSLARTAVEADKAATGAKNAGVGLAYLGYGQYDKAIDEFQKALSKGGLRNEADTRLLLGIAQFKGGHKDEALKTWKTVKGDPVLERVAGLWAVHAKQG